jgi:hypothetical protein
VDLDKAWRACVPADRLMNVTLPLNSIQVPSLFFPSKRGSSHVKRRLALPCLLCGCLFHFTFY